MTGAWASWSAISAIYDCGPGQRRIFGGCFDRSEIRSLGNPGR